MSMLVCGKFNNEIQLPEYGGTLEYRVDYMAEYRRLKQLLTHHILIFLILTENFNVQ